MTLLEHASGFPVASIDCREEGAERAAALDLIGRVDVRGRVITLDALHTTKKTAKTIVNECGADYVFTVTPFLHLCREIVCLSVESLLEDLGEINLTNIHWVIVGGESGSKARPMKPQWVESVQKQCKDQNIPFFFKQRFKGLVDATMTGGEPESVLVLELADRVDDLVRAVEAAGLEWLGEWDIEIDPDDDFPAKGRKATREGRLFVSMVNEEGMRELLSLWMVGLLRWLLCSPSLYRMISSR